MHTEYIVSLKMFFQIIRGYRHQQYIYIVHHILVKTSLVAKIKQMLEYETKIQFLGIY